MNNDDDFDIIDNTLNLTVDVDDDREDEMEEDEENNNKKTNQSMVGYTKTVNLNIDLNKAFNWYRENYIGKFDLENNEAPEITANGDYTTTDTNNNNYQEIDSYTPPSLMKSTEPNTKKTRSLYSDYFRVNVPPPTITDAIDSNGYYKFNGNSLISGTDQDYNLNIDVTPSVLDSISIPKNENSFNILDYNQENNTNYVGVKSIQLTPPEYISCQQLIPSQTSNENMNENNQLIVSNWTININNNSNLWKMFDPTNTASICGLRENSGETLNIFNDSTTPPIPNKIIYKYFRMNNMDNDYIFHKYRILFVGSMNQTTWNTILDIDFSQIDNYDMIYYNEASNAIEIPFVNDIDYKYYQFKTYNWDTWLDNGFTYWNILNCQDATPTPTINNYNEYTSEHPLTINTNGTGVISVPNGYTGLGNVNYEVSVPSPTITEPVTSNGYYKFSGNSLISGTNQDYNLNIAVNTKQVLYLSKFTINKSWTRSYYKSNNSNGINCTISSGNYYAIVVGIVNENNSLFIGYRRAKTAGSSVTVGPKFKSYIQWITWTGYDQGSVTASYNGNGISSFNVEANDESYVGGNADVYNRFVL
jgi:hypothetical protein